MPVRIVFRCDFCRSLPDPITQLALERGLRELGFGEYLEVPPGHWLVWLGAGPLGPRRYACPEHRGDLTAYLREHYGDDRPPPLEAPAVSDDAPVRRYRARDPKRRLLLDPEVGAAMSGSDPLAQPVYAEGEYKPFGDFTLAEVQARADELAAAVGWGPTARVGGVARGWSELARAMSAAGAAQVSALGQDAGADFARRLWVVPPGGSLL